MLVFEQSTSIEVCVTGSASTEVTKLKPFQEFEGSFAVAANGSVTADVAKKTTATSINRCRLAHRPPAV